jgi:hypothetical protein
MGNNSSNIFLTHFVIISGCLQNFIFAPVFQQFDSAVPGGDFYYMSLFDLVTYILHYTQANFSHFFFSWNHF